MKRILFACVAAVTYLAGAQVSAQVSDQGIPITPGKWEMTSIVNTPMMGEPKVTTTNQCLEEDMLTPDAMSSEGMDEGCTIETTQIDGNTMRWAMNCPTTGSEMKGDWTASSTGDTVRGEGLISASFGGQSFEITMSWEGKRVGPCDT